MYAISDLWYTYYMKIKSLILKNYRNYKKANINFNKDKTLIIGKNAQGKTNILESIYMLSDLKSPRTSTIADLISFGDDNFEITAEIVKNDTDIMLSFGYTNEKKRDLKINGVKSTAKDFKNTVKTVLFSTKDLLLLRGTPQDRRDWLDRAISQVYSAYDERLAVYDKIRIQKNSLLKNDYIDEALLDIYNEQLIIAGANIIFLRKKYLKELAAKAKLKHKNISDAENLNLSYSCSCNDIESICTYLREELFKKRNEEFARRQSCVGPHRDDIEFTINDINAIKFSSQGQQRTIVLALKLAELDVIKEKTGITPILLLDDVLAELDELRQNYLIKSIENDVQTIITSVDTILFDNEFLNTVDIIFVENGCLKLTK